MKNSSINCIQKQLNNGFKTVVSFGKRIQVTLTSSQIEKLQNQLRIARLLEPKQLWTSGTYNYMLHGELKN